MDVKWINQWMNEWIKKVASLDVVLLDYCLIV